MRGRKPKPLSIKQATGNPGKRPLNLAEPTFAGGVGSPPAQLDRVAAAEWKRLTKLFQPHGLLKQTDRGILALYCSAFSTWLKAIAAIKKTGGEVLKDTDGDLYPNPWVKISKDCSADVYRLGSSLGLDPSTRTRLVSDVAASLPLTAHTPAKPKTKVDRLPIS